MKRIGLTGNIGSGKSTVAHLLSLMGIPVYNSDNEAKKLYFREDVVEKIVFVVGKQILDISNSINFTKLANEIFANNSKLNAVNKIIHPLVMADYNEWNTKQKNAPFTIFESAIIYEHHLESYFDGVIHVYCPDEIAINRAVLRDHKSIQEIKLRLSQQLDTEIKKEKTDFIICNYQNYSVIEQMLLIIPQLSREKV
jgi:dephospho-CoA kinase